MSSLLRQISLATVTGLVVLSFTPSPSQAGCFWVYCWDGDTRSTGGGGSGAGKANFQDLIVAPPSGQDDSPMPDLGQGAQIAQLRTANRDTAILGGLAAIVIIGAISAGSGTD